MALEDLIRKLPPGSALLVQSDAATGEVHIQAASPRPAPPPSEVDERVVGVDIDDAVSKLNLVLRRLPGKER